MNVPSTMVYYVSDVKSKSAGMHNEAGGLDDPVLELAVKLDGYINRSFAAHQFFTVLKQDFNFLIAGDALDNTETEGGMFDQAADFECAGH